MSGIEVTGLVFGVLPIVIEVVKSYRTVSGSLRTFRHYSKEVKTVSHQQGVAESIFRNECRLLLRLVEDEKGAETMLKDDADRRWTSKELNDKLIMVLNDNFQPFQSVVEETRDIIDRMKKELNKFDVLAKQREQGESVKSAIKRLREAAKITFDKPKYEKYLAELRDRNADLKHLRSQIVAFQQQDSCASGTCVQPKALPTRFQSIKAASQKLHQALCSAWCCDDPGHRGHYAKLCLDAEVQTGVCLDLAISCHETFAERHDGIPPEPPIWLYVQSASIDTTVRAEIASKANTGLQPSSSTMPSGVLPSSALLKKKASSDLAQAVMKRKKKKQVHFTCDVSAKVLFSSPVTTEDPHCGSSKCKPEEAIQMLNLCHTDNICYYLKRNLQACNDFQSKHCIGYLETPQMYRHSFYLQAKKSSASARLEDVNQTAICSIYQLMKQEADDFLDVKCQLKLAHKTALAVLQFNDTSWLPQRWRLQDLGYFGSERIFDETSLETLHLSSQISPPNRSHAQAMEGVEHPDATVSDEIRFGINNTTLFFLGVALLEIAHWKPLEEKMTSKDLDNQIFAARRLASARAPLGPQYQKIAQKCLQCNFGFGTELSRKELQAAVYNDVVCQIEGMMEALSI